MEEHAERLAPHKIKTTTRTITSAAPRSYQSQDNTNCSWTAQPRRVSWEPRLLA